jgi:hypothetical protein
MSVLVIDDDADLLAILNYLLGFEGNRPVEATPHTERVMMRLRCVAKISRAQREFNDQRES